MAGKALLERFLQYVRIDTTAADDATAYPSSGGQCELGRLLVEQLQAMGVSSAVQDSHGVVHAEIPSNQTRVDGATPPTIVWCSHLDTSPETSGANVRPQVIEGYAGGDIVLPGDPSQVIRVEANPELKTLGGKTLITTDGTTLLGADDKAGVAVIMEAVDRLMARPELPHGPIRVCFTCDEEIGRGVDHIDVPALGAAAGYTLDGQGVNTIDVETFSADLAIIEFEGRNIHPSIGKDRMVNSLKAAAYFIERLPKGELSPETTEDREGFVHPYDLIGGVGSSSLKVLLRDFDAENLDRQAELLRAIADDTRTAVPGVAIKIERRTQYRNMSEGLAKEPRAAALAEKALRAVGIEPERAIVRGGTDGSRLTELGLPTPNLGCGQHTPHSVLEWACLEEMETAVDALIALAALWASEST